MSNTMGQSPIPPQLLQLMMQNQQQSQMLGQPQQNQSLNNLRQQGAQAGGQFNQGLLGGLTNPSAASPTMNTPATSGLLSGGPSLPAQSGNGITTSAYTPPPMPVDLPASSASGSPSMGGLMGMATNPNGAGAALGSKIATSMLGK